MHMSGYRWLWLLFVAAILTLLDEPECLAQSRSRLLVDDVTISRSHVGFSYAGDIWIVDRKGGEARRLTDYPGYEGVPVFSPDGSQIAFAANNNDNWDVYMISAAGTQLRRLTYHPGVELPRGWTPDGKRVLIASSRSAWGFRLFTVPSQGGLAEELPFPHAGLGSFSPDGARIVHTQ